MSAENSQNFKSYSIITLLLPLIGFILAIVYLSKGNEKDRKLGEYLLILSFFISILWTVGTIAIASYKPTQSQSNSDVQTFQPQIDSGYKNHRNDHLLNSQGEPVGQ